MRIVSVFMLRCAAVMIAERAGFSERLSIWTVFVAGSQNMN